MTIIQGIVLVFALLIFGLMLPLPSGWRTALYLALIMLGVLTFIGGGVQYAISLVQ